MMPEERERLSDLLQRSNEAVERAREAREYSRAIVERSRDLRADLEQLRQRVEGQPEVINIQRIPSPMSLACPLCNARPGDV